MSEIDAPRPLTPEARRRDRFDPGLPVVLDDGQTWELAPITLGWGFTREGGKTRPVPRAVDGYEAILDQYLEANDPEEVACAMTDCAYALLAHNYDVTFEEAGRHLLYRARPGTSGAEASAETWSQIAAWVVGQRPKATADGSEPP